MKKAVEIISVEYNNSDVVVTYITGTVRVYKAEKLPKTVQAWRAAHKAEPEKAEEEKPESKTGFVIVADVLQLPAVTGETALAVTEEAPEVITDEEVIIEGIDEGRPEPWLTMGGVIACAAKEAAVMAGAFIVSAAKVAMKEAPKAAAAAVKGVAWTADKVISLYYWLTTYAPILARRLMFFLVWDVLPALKEARKATMKAAGITGRALERAAVAAGGWALVTILYGVGIAVKTGKAVASGWAMRKEIIEEMA